MLNYDEIKKNQETIKEFCKLYRKELTEMQAEVAEFRDLCDKESYIKVFDEMSFDEYVGNMYAGLVNEETIALYKTILDGEMTIDELLEQAKEAWGLFD